MNDQVQDGMTAIEHHFAKMAKRVIEREQALVDWAEGRRAEDARLRMETAIGRDRSPFETVLEQVRAGSTKRSRIIERLSGWLSGW